MLIVILNGNSLLRSQSDTLLLSLSDPLTDHSSLFNNDSIFFCTLKFDFKEFQHEKSSGKYIDAELFIASDSGYTLQKDVRIKARGISRKNLCSFPPFWIQMYKSKKDENGGQIKENLKVVTHCDPSPMFEQYLLREYLSYKIYNILTPYSFQVKLMQIKYIDSGRNNKSFTRFAFLIEPVEDMALRLNAVEIKLDEAGFYATDERQTDLLSIWAYMMGNTDWSVTGRHNIKLLKLNSLEFPKLIPIPYDFDVSGFVNAGYASPTEGLGLTNVKQRMYVGPCRKVMEYKIAAQQLINRKNEIYALIRNFKYIEQSEKQELIHYLDEFYTQLYKSNFFQNYIDINCIESK